MKTKVVRCTRCSSLKYKHNCAYVKDKLHCVACSITLLRSYAF